MSVPSRPMTLRRTPGDFVVHERLSPAFSSGLSPRPGAGALIAVFELSKESMTTPEAIDQLARALGVRPGTIGYAGLKDKHARTTQHVSVRAPGGSMGARTLVSEAEGPSWSARLVGWSRHELAAPAIDGNSFKIVVRGLSERDAGEMGRRAALLADGAGASSLLVVNYFGAQRFGSARHGQGWAARRLIEGDFEGALRLTIGTPARKDAGKTRAFTRGLAAGWGEWARLAHELPRCPERRAVEALAAGAGFKEAFAALPAFLQSMVVEAYQSMLWNQTARRMMNGLAAEAGAAQASAPDGGAGGDPSHRAELIRTPDEFGEMVFPPATLVPEAWRDMEMPVLAKNTRLEGPWREAASDALREEGIGVEQLKIPGVRRPFFGDAMRRLFVRAAGFSLSAPERDELGGPGALRRTASFDLPRGAYATVVLRALGQ